MKFKDLKQEDKNLIYDLEEERKKLEAFLEHVIQNFKSLGSEISTELSRIRMIENNAKSINRVSTKNFKAKTLMLFRIRETKTTKERMLADRKLLLADRKLLNSRPSGYPPRTVRYKLSVIYFKLLKLDESISYLDEKLKELRVLKGDFLSYNYFVGHLSKIYSIQSAY